MPCGLVSTCGLQQAQICMHAQLPCIPDLGLCRTACTPRAPLRAGMAAYMGVLYVLAIGCTKGCDILASFGFSLLQYFVATLFGVVNLSHILNFSQLLFCSNRYYLGVDNLNNSSMRSCICSYIRRSRRICSLYQIAQPIANRQRRGALSVCYPVLWLPGGIGAIMMRLLKCF